MFTGNEFALDRVPALMGNPGVRISMEEVTVLA